MGIGASIFMIVLGAILTFALDVEVGGIDLDVVGWIFMIGGLLGLLFVTLIWGPRRRTVSTTGTPTEYRRVEERTDI